MLIKERQPESWIDDAGGIRKDAWLKRVVLWSLLAVYTVALPHVISVYALIANQFSPAVAGKIPLAIIIGMGVFYLALCAGFKRSGQCLGPLLGSAIIISFVLYFESRPNKQIHIPEYIIMAWIIYAVLSIDYRGKGIFILTFICASLLGVVDELQQGIHPARFFGWSDMVVNAASTGAGILTIIGLGKGLGGNWSWVRDIYKQKLSLGCLLSGIVGTLLICLFLFDVQATQTFRGVYPSWLLLYNGLFFVCAAVMVLLHGCRVFGMGIHSRSMNESSDETIHLWFFYILVIFVLIHGLAMTTVVFEVAFA